MVSYFEVIQLMPDIDANNKDDYLLIDCPPLKRMPSRPRKFQRKSNVEKSAGTQKAR